MTYQFSQKVRPNMRPSVCAVRRGLTASNSSFSCSVEWYVSVGCPMRARGIAYSTCTAATPGEMSIDASRAAGRVALRLLPSLPTVANELRWHSKQS